MRRILVLAILAALLACGTPQAPETPEAPVGTAATGSEYERAARAAADWIRSTAQKSELGVGWPADPYETGTVTSNLYAGTAGVVLFFLELAAYTGEASYLDDARTGAELLLARVGMSSLGRDEPQPWYHGLYIGAAGVGFALNETYRATGEERYRDGALEVVELIHAQARDVGGGVDWLDSTDIISGSAGIGLFLLYAAREMDHGASLQLAERAGRRLLEVAETHDAGLGWRMASDYERLMPNFSHGTAGVAYFLAALYEATGEPAFLDAAVAGARRLLSLAETEGDVCLVFHHTGGGEELQYLSWCHGPAGTGRTFYKLWQVTDDPAWMEWTEKSANGVYKSGIPETLTEGFWNNVGQCCGSAGVAELAMAMHAVSDPSGRHFDFARRVADNVLSRATEDGGGLMWVQAEHRVKPDFLVAQTGYMQGAAGIGMMLLHLDAIVTGRDSPRIVFPDSPF